MSVPATYTVGDTEAGTRLPELLELVARGEEVTITHDGDPVARLVPARSVSSTERRAEAISQMRELAVRNRLGGLRIQDLIAEGRK